MKPSRMVLLLKRCLDLAGGAAGMLLFLLTYPLIALLIKLESPGPALYSQERVGVNRRDRRSRAGYPGAGPERRRADYGGRPFRILKYRTMRIDAEADGPRLCANGGADPRVTRLGRWLRALHIDEIPQFLNVVRGDMSLVGPRPERPHFTTQYQATLPHYSDRTHRIRPGITGLAQILLGYDESHESVVRKSHYDLSYRASFCSVAAWLRMDLWIWAHTVLYLLQRPRVEGDARELDGLKRAKLLPFQGRAPGARRNTSVTVSFGREAPSLMLASIDPGELSERLDAIDFSGRPAPTVYVRPKENLDLADLGLLVRLAHQVKARGGTLYLRNPDPKVRKILREIRFDGMFDMRQSSTRVGNFLTVDTECWFHAYHMRKVAPKCSWHLLPSNVERDTEKILELLRAHGTKATFFVLGWVADHFPDVVRMIDREGHEIGTHGYHHDLITEMTPSQFEYDLTRSLEALSRLTAQKIRGHRASNFSLVKSTLWALEIMARHGIEYDSSIFPVARDRYGMPDYPNRMPHLLRLPDGSSIKEIPMSTTLMGGRILPICGGGYFRLYPHRMTEKFIAQSNLRGLPAMVYVHPWEFDTEQKKHYLGAWKTFQHYVNLDTTHWKLNRLLQRFDFGSVSEVLELPRLQGLLRRRPVEAALLHGDHQYIAPRLPVHAHKVETYAEPAIRPAAPEPILEMASAPSQAEDLEPVLAERRRG